MPREKGKKQRKSKANGIQKENMRKINPFGVVILACVAFVCMPQEAQPQSRLPLHYFSYDTTVMVNAKTPSYVFRFVIDKDTNEYGAVSAVSCIEIRRAKKRQISQVLRNFNTVHRFDPADVVFTDLNFDGYLDFMLSKDYGSGGQWYHVWICDPKTGRYKYNEDLGELGELTADSVTKTLRSVEQSGASDGMEAEYRLVNGKLVRLSEEETRFDETIQRSIVTKKRFRNSRIISITIDTLRN